MEILEKRKRVERVRHELRRRDVQVVRVEPLGSEFVRIVFGGDALADFVSLGFDDHVKFMVDDATGEPVRRDYTPRHFDPARRELTIDFALHGAGTAANWARQAAVGQRAVIGGPRGSRIVPTDYAWHLLAGDATAAPAIGRRLSELPEGMQAIVVVQLADLAALELSRSVAAVELHQVATADEMVAAVGGLSLPTGEGYVWSAGEASVMARLRNILVERKFHPHEAMRVAAYWKSGASSYHDELATPVAN
jgi:NADPH-dependent ferric siderophore reductase